MIRYLYKNGKRYNETKGMYFLHKHEHLFSEKNKIWKWPCFNSNVFFAKINEENETELYYRVCIC